MRDEQFEWDNAKAADNLTKHRVSFEMAREIFKDAFAIDELDADNSEDENRYTRIGMVEGHLLFIAYTLRAELIRIISARRAEPYERKRYHEENRN